MHLDTILCSVCASAALQPSAAIKKKVKTRESSLLFSVYHPSIHRWPTIDHRAHRCRSRCHACVDCTIASVDTHSLALSALLADVIARAQRRFAVRNRHFFSRQLFHGEDHLWGLFAKAVWLWNKPRWTPDVRAASQACRTGNGQPLCAAPREYVSRKATALLALVLQSLALKNLTSQPTLSPSSTVVQRRGRAAMKNRLECLMPAYPLLEIEHNAA